MYSFHAMRSKLPLAALKTAVHLVAQQPFVQKKVQKLGEKTCCQKIVSYPACTTAASVPEKEGDIHTFMPEDYSGNRQKGVLMNHIIFMYISDMKWKTFECVLLHFTDTF